jgi:hypothetical protein
MGISSFDSEKTKNYKGIEQNAIEEIRKIFPSESAAGSNSPSTAAGILTLL